MPEQTHEINPEDAAMLDALEREGEAWLDALNEQLYREWMEQLAEESR